MKLIVGLGNPGEKYKNNRHNAGYIVVDALASKIPNKSKILIFKSNMFMNQSGEFVKKLVEQYNINLSDLWVIHDDLDIPLESYKIQKGRGPKLHKGILSIEKELGSDDFWRVRVGIENRNYELGIKNYDGRKVSGEDYVLQDFGEDEKRVLDRAIKRIIKEFLTISH